MDFLMQIILIGFAKFTFHIQEDECDIKSLWNVSSCNYLKQFIYLFFKFSHKRQLCGGGLNKTLNN